MPKATVKRTGIKDDVHYALVQKRQDNFLLSGWIHTVEPMEEGEEIDLPSNIDAKVDWQT